MNRKNLTAAVLAGLAGIAGIAGTAQAVNLNPDGVGQVLIYPYYTSNGGNQTILSVVNTTDNAKAVKVRFLEGYNSREVLDFNLYMSAFDVWVAAIADDAGTPTLYIPDDSCTVPYIYGDFDGEQPFLDFAYNNHFDSKGDPVFEEDGGPTGIDRAAEGYFEMIEMGTLVGESATDATHVLHEILDDIEFHDGHETHDHDDHTVVDSFWAPGDCDQLVENWTIFIGKSDDGIWISEPAFNIERNSGGLFGGASVVNSENGTMYSYNALAIQGYDKTDGERHVVPGTSEPGLNSGDSSDGTHKDAWVFFGVPQNRAVELKYSRGVDAISAVFMHETIVNEYTLDEALSATTEWVITFPTKSFYVDESFVFDLGDWIPDEDDNGCGGWEPGDGFPTTKPIGGADIDGPGPWGNITTDPNFEWSECSYVFEEDIDIEPRAPFTSEFAGEACEEVTLKTWDRDERTAGVTPATGEIPPVVSPSIPCDVNVEECNVEFTPFELCYEVNVMRFGPEVSIGGPDGGIFATPDLGGSSLLIEVDPGFENGWARIDFSTDSDHVDSADLVGLPVTGFAAYEFENAFVTGDDGVQDVKAFYGGLFGHKGSVRRK